MPKEKLAAVLRFVPSVVVLSVALLCVHSVSLCACVVSCAGVLYVHASLCVWHPVQALVWHSVADELEMDLEAVFTDRVRASRCGCLAAEVSVLACA